MILFKKNISIRYAFTFVRNQSVRWGLPLDFRVLSCDKFNHYLLHFFQNYNNINIQLFSRCKNLMNIKI